MNTRNGTLLLVSACVAATFAAACSKKSSSTPSGGGFTLETASYVYSNESVSTNGCQVSVTSLNGDSESVSMAGNTVTFGAGSTATTFTLTTGHTYAEAPENFPLDWTNTAAASYPT